MSIYKEIEGIFEQFEIKNIMDSRKKNYDPQKNIPWKKIKDYEKLPKNPENAGNSYLP